MPAEVDERASQREGSRFRRAILDRMHAPGDLPRRFFGRLSLLARNV
ncbi:MAG: hypothetical protein ACHRXM_40560 [Isosphaerales bacterium]